MRNVALALMVVFASGLEIKQDQIKQEETIALSAPKLLKVKGYDNQAFRTASCKDIVKDGHPFGSNAELMDLIQVSKPRKSPKVACLMYSHKENRQKQRDSFATWGQDCDEFLAFSNEAWEDKQAGFKTIESHPENGDEKNLIGKLRAAFKETMRRVKAGELSFDFLAVGGDDTFWIIPNLKEQLATDARIQKLTAEGTGLLYGHMFAQGGQLENAFPSGSGYVLDQKAIEKYLKNEVKDSGWWEDVAIAQVMMKEGVPMLHAQSKTGEHLMHPFQPEGMIKPDLYYDTSGDWFSTYEKPFLKNMKGKKGAATISPKSLLFHYSNGMDKYKMHDRLYFKQTCLGDENSPQ